MKTLTNYINDAIKIGKFTSNISIYSCQPKTRKELEDIIDKRIEQEGPNCDLNDIDTSKITNMSFLFYGSKFTGNISKWDVSNVKDMNSMFTWSNFDGDISRWDVSNVEDMESMFAGNKYFYCDLSKWDVSKVKNMAGMFAHSVFNADISNWDVRNVEDMRWMFIGSKFNQDISNWKIREDCHTNNAFIQTNDQDRKLNI